MTSFETRAADWLSVDEARQRILARVRLTGVEALPLGEALSRALAEPRRATATLPPWDNSAMDGYAVRASDLQGASAGTPVRLRVVGEVRAGDRPDRPVGDGEAIRIMTGAPVPAGADSVVRVEDTDGESTPGEVAVLSARDAGRNVRPGGEDMTAGEAVLEAGTTLGAGQIGVLAALGEPVVPAHRAPWVGLLANGDELVPLDRFDEVRSGRAIPETNTWALAAAVRELGGRPVPLGIARDSEDSILERLQAALASDADILLTVAGAAMGEADLFKRVLDRLGFELDFWRVKVRPGSPVSFGLLPRPGDDRDALPVFGLPGNPASSFVTFQILVRPFLLATAGHARIHLPVTLARAGDALPSRSDLTHFFRVRLEGGMHPPVARLTGPQGSGLVRSLGDADGLAVVPEGQEAVEAGESVEVVLLSGGGARREAGFSARVS